ncbi:MAG: nucleotidyltransferase family protein [Clostridia bacterium]|nr:nucleotidyltransferase family protein [Clostridia bacterium]
MKTEAITLPGTPGEAVPYLCGCAVNGTVPASDLISGMDLDALYLEAARHSVAAAVGQALESAGISTPKFREAVGRAQRKTILLDHERAAVSARLNDAGIRYLFMKGSVIKDLYPKFGMREMVDCDILFDRDRASDVRDIMVSMGYAVETYDVSNHDIYVKKPVYCFEMHRELFDMNENPELAAYFENIKIILPDKVGDCCCRLSDEDLYLYLQAHDYSHYSFGGTGIRSLLDTYVFLKRYSDKIDWDYIEQETGKLGVSEFEKKNRSLAAHLFGGEELTAEDRKMLEYRLESGTMGTMEHIVKNGVKNSGNGFAGKVRYVIGRLFPPLSEIRRYHPFFWKHKVLLPFFPIYRICYSVRKKRFSRKLKAIIKP